jgi:hypothetical protein
MKIEVKELLVRSFHGGENFCYWGMLAYDSVWLGLRKKLLPPTSG